MINSDRINNKHSNKMPHKEISGVENINPKNFGGMCSRAVTLERPKEINFERGIDTIATTDAPALVIDWERWEVIREILPMRYCEMPANDKVPLLDSHSRFSVEQVKGSAMNWETNEHQLLCKSFLSESEEVIRQKIREGHIDSVSIGYMTDKDYSIEVPKKATVIIDGKAYKNEFEDDYPMVIRTWWRTKELSLVPIGADEAAKFKTVGDLSMKKVIDELNKLRGEINELKAQKNNVTEKSKALYEKRLKLIDYELQQFN